MIEMFIVLRLIIFVRALFARLIPHPIIVIDTETTDLSVSSGELLQVAIISGTGRVLFNRYIKPQYTTSWPEAERVNHISPARVRLCPHIDVYVPLLKAIIENAKTVVGYNVNFDLGFLASEGIFTTAETIDVMQDERAKRGGAYKSLVKVAGELGYRFNAHDALEDCKATLFVYNQIHNNLSFTVIRTVKALLLIDIGAFLSVWLPTVFTHSLEIMSVSEKKKDFNWKAAEADVEELGGELERLYTMNDKQRDSYLRELDLNPDRYKKKTKPTGSSSSSTEGCYIATCVYGSYDCPEVWTLRRFRDSVLKQHVLGRLFVWCYYKVSPSLVRWFGNSNWFRQLWKPGLESAVRGLQAKGVSSDPYRDRVRR